MKFLTVAGSRLGYATKIQPKFGFCASSRNQSDKSIYHRYGESKKPRAVYGQPYPDWRNPWTERNGKLGKRTSKCSFDECPSPDILNAFQNIPNLDFQQVKDWWKKMKVIQEIENQRYLPKRVAMLGANLAAIHFFTYRQGAVRLKDSKEWITGNILTLDETLPKTFVKGYQVEAIDCSSFHHNGIRYEGLLNLMGLNCLKWLSLKNQKHIDAWCLDRIAGLTGKTIEYLDISACKLDVSCIYALAKMPALKTLAISDPGHNMVTQAALSILEKEKTDLVIKCKDLKHSKMCEKRGEKSVSKPADSS